MSEFEFVRTAEIREKKILLQLYNQKKLKHAMLQKFAQQCLADIVSECKKMQPQWKVAQCAWGPEEEEEMKVRSVFCRSVHVVLINT